MSAIERFPHGPFEPSEALGEVPPQESLQLLAHEHEKTARDPRPAGALTLEDLERLARPRDRELILSLA